MSQSVPPPVVYNSLDSHVKLYRRMTEQDRAVVSHKPVLLGLIADALRPAAQSFHTQFDETPVGAGAARMSTSGDLLVIPISKRKEGPFEERIGVGRTRTSDICLLYNGVSKYHAFFTVDKESGAITLTDADSKNGTSVDGVALTPRIPHRLVDRGVVRFGSANFRFHTAEGFRRLIETLL